MATRCFGFPRYAMDPPGRAMPDCLIAARIANHMERVFHGGSARADLADAKKAPSAALGASAAGGGGIAALIAQAQDQLQPYAEAVPALQKVLAGLAIAGLVVAAGGIAYGFYARYRAKQLNNALDLVPEAV